MGRVSIPYALMVQRHPDAVVKILAKLRKGKSKHRDTPADKLEWEYSYAVICNSRPVPADVETYVADLVAHTTVRVIARIGRWDASGEEIKGCPEEVVALHRLTALDFLSSRSSG